MATMRSSRSSATAVLGDLQRIAESSRSRDARHCFSAPAPADHKATTPKAAAKAQRLMQAHPRLCLEPARRIGDEGHDDETGKTDKELRHDGIFVTGDDDLGGDSKKSTETEYLQGMLSAPANWLEDTPFQEPGVWPHSSRTSQARARKWMKRRMSRLVLSIG